MGFDLSLTNTGDLSFTISDFKSKNGLFDFNFHIAPSDSFLLNFVIENNKVSYKNISKIKTDLTIMTLEELEILGDLEPNTKIYVVNTNENYIVTATGKIKRVDVSPMLDFEFYLYSLNHDKASQIVTDKSYIQQAIKLRLDSESGTIKGNEMLGANLFALMHSNMQSAKLLDNICARVKTALSDILPNCTVKAYIINSEYFNYHNSIKIVIINNEEVYYYYV